MARAPQPSTSSPASTSPEATTLSIRKLFQLGRFEPALAQREYQWEYPQWDDLLNDLESAFRFAGKGPAEQIEKQTGEREAPAGPATKTKEPVEKGRKARVLPIPPAVSHYYLGHIMLLPREAGQSGQYLIYDGQQRLTTLTLLLCALRDAAGGHGEWLTIQEALRTPPPANAPRLTVTTRGNALARIVAELNGTRRPSHTGSFTPADHRMYDAAAFLLDRVSRWAPEKRRAFAEFMLDGVFASVTIMKDRRVAEYAYITINTRGRALENKDIIKGHFNQLASRHSLEAANEMSRQWAALERLAGRRLDDIMRLAFLLDYRRQPSFDFGAQLMDYFADESRFGEVKEWVEVRLPALITLYNRIVLDPSRAAILGPPDTHLRRMTFLPWDYWQALALRFAERDLKAPIRFQRSIAALEKWCFCINLIDVDDHHIARIVIDVLDQVDKDIDPFGPEGELRMSRTWKERARSRVQDGQITDPRRRGAHVRWLETLYWPVSAINFGATNDCSVEHVLPRGANGKWLTDFPQSIHIYTEQFGNLCLVPKAINERIGNDQYAEKRAAYAKLSKDCKSAQDVAKAKAWLPAAVQARTDALSAKALAALGLAPPVK
jgi:hypothetical protein